MLEIKSYDDWLANQENVAEPTTNLKNYTDYVRSSYYSAGQLNRETEQEIAAGVADRLESDGLFTEDMSEDDKNNLYSSVVGASRNVDTDARFVLDHLRTNYDGPANVLANEAKASNLANYLTLREKAPSEAEGFKPYVDEILADKSLVKRARMSAVDRGEYSITALDEEDGTRSLYAGANARPDAIAGEVKSLLATGALSSADLYRVNDFVKPLNGGLTNGAEDSRYEMFARTVSDLAKTDKDLNQLIEKNASDKKETDTAALRTTGESILEGAKTIISYPFVKGGELLVDLFDGEQKQPKYAPDTTLSDALAGNSAFNQRFSAAEIEKFSEALTTKVAGPAYRADRPETGITTDSMGNISIAPSLLANTTLFEQAVSASPLNKEQQRQASTQRKLLLDSAAPDLLRMILEESPEAVSSYAKAKADGLSPSEFIERHVGSGKDYDAFGIRLEQFGKSAWKTLAEIPLGIAALAGNEWAATAMGSMMKDQARRQEYSRLFGDEYGFGFQLLNTLPQVATDIGLTIGTGGAFAGAKALAKTGAMSARAMIRGGAKMALSEVDDVAAASFRKAASAEGSQFLGKAITDVGKSFGSKFGELAPLAAVTFTRSASSAFGSLYNQLPDDMSHEEKYKTALPTALAMGVSTSVITVGMSALGFGAVENIGTNAVRKIRGGDTLTARSVQEAAERAVPVSKMNYRQAKQAYQNAANEGRILSDKAFNTAARAAITSTYKNWLKTTLKGGLSEAFEEALDQAVGMAIENSALDRDTSLAEKVAQVFDAGLLGGALGAGIAGSTQFGGVRKSEQSLVFEGRASAFEDISKRLRKTGSDATADVLQRRIDEAREQARLSIERDIAKQKTKGRTVVADPNERPLRGQPVFNEETGQWSLADEPFDPLLDDILGEEIEYSGFNGVLELDAYGSSVVLRLNKPYTTEGGGSVEFINLGPRFQKASKFTAPLLTIGQETFGVPAGTPYISMGGKKKTKFAFPAKEKVIPESFEIFRDDEGNVRSLIVKGGLSLKDGSTTMNIPLTSSLQIKAIAEWYGIDISPKPPVIETPEGQFEFFFAGSKGTAKSKEEFGFGKGIAPDEPELTDEELKAETEDILGRSFAPATEGEMELVNADRNNMRRGLERLDAQISRKTLALKRITGILDRYKERSDEELTEDEKYIQEQSVRVKKNLNKELTALRKTKKNIGDDAILLGTKDATPAPAAAELQGPRVYRSANSAQEQLGRDFAELLDGIRQSYLDADVPIDVARIENVVRSIPINNKFVAVDAFSDISSEELDAVESMAQAIIDFAGGPTDSVTAKQRRLISEDYANLLARIAIAKEYVVELEYETMFQVALGDISKLLIERETEVEVEVETKASDVDTLHYLLTTAPDTISVVSRYVKKKAATEEAAVEETKPVTTKKGAKKATAKKDTTTSVRIGGYDPETREIISQEFGSEVRTPLANVVFEEPELRKVVNANSAKVFAIAQQARKEAAASKRRMKQPIEDRTIAFLNKVNEYITKSKELKDRLEETKRKLPAAKRSVVVPRIEGQLAELRKRATDYVNRVGSILQSEIDFYEDLKGEQKQEIAAQIRRSLFGVGGFKQEVAPRAKVKAFNPTPDIKVTRVVYAKDQFRNGTQEEDLFNELVEGGYDVNLPDTGKGLAQAGLFITESGVSKFPAFSQSQVELVEQEGQEVADTNDYIKDKHKLLSERVLSKYPQLGELVITTGRSRTKGTIGSVGDTEAMLDSMEVQIQVMEQQIRRKSFGTGEVPADFLRKLDVLKEEAESIKVRLKTERHYEIDGKEYEVRNSKTDKGIYFPIDDNGFGIFTNNYRITKAQIAEGYRVIIINPDNFDRSKFNPSQYVNERDPRIIEGYYKPRNPEPFVTGSFNSGLNSRITEDGEQIIEGRSTFLNKRVDLFVYKMLYLSEVKGMAGDAYVGALRSVAAIAEGFLTGKKQKSPERIPKTEQYIDNTISELTLGFAADLNEYRLAQYVAKQAIKSLEFKFKNEGEKELVGRYLGDPNNKLRFSDLSEDVRDQLIFDNLNKTNLVKFVTDMIDGDVESIAKDIQSVNKTIKGSDPNSIIIEYARFLFVNATILGGKFDAMPDPNTYLNRPVSGSEGKGSIYNLVANKNAKAEQADPNTGLSSLDYFVDRGKDNRNTAEEIIGPEATDIFQKLQDEIDRRNQELGGGLDPLDMLRTEDTSALGASELTFMNRPALLTDELYRTIAQDKSGKLVQVFRDLAIAINIPQSQVDNLPDATLVQALAAKLNTDYILHTNKGYARVVLSTLSGSDPNGYFGGPIGDLGKQAAGLLIALDWLPPTIVETKGRTRSLPLRAPAERVAPRPAAAMDATPEEAIAAGKAMRQEEAEATDDEVINYSRDYLEASQAALPYLLKLASERRVALNTIEEARLDLFDSFRLLRALIGQTDPDDMGPAQLKTKRQIAEGIEIGRVGATPESIVDYQNKTISDIEAEIAKLQDTRTLTQAFVDGKGGILARIEAIKEGAAQFDEAGIRIGRTKPLLIATKDPKKKTALRLELKNLVQTYVELNGKGDETLADLDASIATKQKQLEKAKAIRELSGPVLINKLIEDIEAAYAQIRDNRESLSELSESARARVKSESQRIERLRKLPEWQQYVEIITSSPIILRGRKDISEKLRRRLDKIEADATERKTFDDAIQARAKALDQVLIKSGINVPKSGLITNYENPIDVPKKNDFQPSEGQFTNPNARPVGRPRKQAVVFSEEDFSAIERMQSTPESLSEVVRPILRSGEQFVPAIPPLPTKAVGGRIKVLSKPKEYDPNDKFFSLSQIDPSLRDEARAENLRVVSQLGLVSGDPNSVLGALRRITQTGTPRQQLIAELLLTAPDFIRDINFVMVEVDLGFAGLYDKTSNSVLVNLNEHNGRGLVDVLLHEYLHAPTAKVLLNPRTESQRKAVARIEAIRNFAIANAAKLGMDTDPVVRLGLSSNAEFLTYALTAPEFQNILAGLAPFDQRSILRRLVDAILNVFGLDPKKHEVAADAIQELLDFTKMSLAHAGTFSVDNKWRAMVGTVSSRNERAQAYSNLTAANLINDVISRDNEGDEDSILLAGGSGRRPLAVSGTAAEIDEQVRFTPEERARWQIMAKRARMETTVDVDTDLDTYEFFDDSYELAPELELDSELARADGDEAYGRARRAWDQAIYGIFKRAGYDVSEARKNYPYKKSGSILDEELVIVEHFFMEAGQPLMNWFSQDGASYRINAYGALGMDRVIKPDFKRSITHLLVGLDRNRMSGDPDRQTAVARIVKAYIEAFAPEAELDNMRKWFRDFFSENSPAQGVSVVVQGGVIDPVMGAKVAVEYYRQSLDTPKGQKLPETPNVVGVVWRGGSGAKLQTLSREGKWREAEKVALMALYKQPAYTDVRFRNPFDMTSDDTRYIRTGELEDKEFFDSMVEDILTRYEGGGEGVFAAASDVKPFTLIATPEEIDQQVKFTPEERQRFINFSKANHKAIDLDVTAATNNLFGEPTDAELSDEEIQTIIDKINTGKLTDSTEFSSAPILDLWPKEVKAILRRAGYDEYVLDKKVNDLMELGGEARWWKGADNGQLYRFWQAGTFFYNGQYPLWDINRDEDGSAGGLENSLADRNPNFGEAIGQLYWYLTDLIKDGGAKKYFVSPDLAEQLKVASRRMLMAYAEAFAPENEIEIARSWVRSVIRDKGKAKPADGDYTHTRYIRAGEPRYVYGARVDADQTDVLGEIRRDNDAAYLAAVEAGDMETAQRMVDEAAKVAGYERIYHGTFAGHDPRSAEKTIKLTLENLILPAFFTNSQGDPSYKMRGGMDKRRGTSVEAFARISDGKITGTQDQYRHYEVQNRADLKSADPVTYDDKGNVIPLSQRFRTTSDDTRYIRTGEPRYVYGARVDADQTDVLGEIRRITPEGINIEINNTMVGAMGASPTKPNTILVNENLVATMAAGLSAANARAVVRTAVDEELAHLASFAVFKTEDFAAIAAEIGPDRVNEILDMIYSSAVPDDTERAARIAADREAGVTGDIDAAAEWVRMEITRMATGRTREADIAFFYTNPSLLERFLEGLRAFINKLKQQFKSEPTAGTAARISQASRSFRKLRNGGVIPTPEPSAANEYGDSTAFLNAINGDIAEGQEDRTYFMLPVSGTGNSKAAVSGFWKTVQDKMYNLPMELRKYLSMRDGTISQVEYTIQDFDRRFPKMRDAALARGASIEDIGMILGTTAPVVQGEARKEIQRKVREFKTKNAKDPDLERKADDYEAKLTQPEADKFFAAFRKEQKAMETKLKSAGFGDLVDYLVEFRGEINKYKAVINFDESNDVYLTRTFRFFGSEGWASFAKTGGVAMLDGKEVNFDKLRAAAAKHFEWEVNNEAKQTGQTFTAEQHDKKLVEYLDKYLKNLELQAADAKELGAMNTIRKDVNRLLNKKDFDAPLRTLLGEVTDPFENAVRTVYNVGRLAANDRFLRNFAQQAIEIEVASRTRKPDMELLFPPTQSAQLGDLAGLYVRKDIAATIREELGMNGMKQQSKAMEQINLFGRFIAKFSGLSITAKTLGSVGFYPRNLLGGFALTTAQGIINPVYLKEAFRLSIVANMSLNGKVKAESEESRNQIRRLVELQVLKDETRGRIAMDMLNGFVNSTDQQLEELLNDIIEAQGSGNIEKIIKKFKLKGTREAAEQAGGSTVEFLASLNNVIDSAFKLNAYFYELSVLKEAYGDTETDSKLEADAARKVKLTFPTHSDQLSLAKAFNKSPFSIVALPFVRWKTEVLRTMFNTIPLAVEEIKSGNPTMRSRGVKRLIGFVTTMAGGSAAYGAIFATLFSLLTDDDEEDERGGVRKLNDEELDALRQGLPVWQRNHGIFAQLLQDGSVQVIDMSNILPHSLVADIAGLASRGNIKGIADYITSEMIGTQIAASAVLEVAQNRDDFGQPIWLDTDGALGASFKILKHLAAGTIRPSIVDKAIKIGRYGEHNAKEMIVGELTGVRPIIHKVTDIEYRGMRNLKESADAVVSLLYPLSSGKALDPSKVEGIMDDHQSASNKNQQKLHDFLMGMQSIGSTEASLAATAQQMKFSKQRFGAALAGENIPWGANEQWFRKMYDNKIRVGEQNPDEIASEINRVRSQKADGYNVNFLQ